MSQEKIYLISEIPKSIRNAFENILKNIDAAKHVGNATCVDISNRYIADIGVDKWSLIAQHLRKYGFQILDSDKYIKSSGATDGLKISWSE